MASIRDLYTSPIDFKALSLIDSDFARQFAADGSSVNFSNAASVRQLTVSLLKRDFGLHVDLPDDRLCPPVPNRLSYILWMQDIIDSTGPRLEGGYDEDRTVVGLDIGTGSSCIYPLLGCALRPEWRFLATDIDPKNLQYAEANVERNSLEDRIKVCKTTVAGPLIPLDALRIEKIDFVMTNPPFYTSTESMLESAAAKSRPPFSACTGAEIEMVTDGGEVVFVKRIFEESKLLADRVQWFSAMFGKLESAREVVSAITATDQHHKANFAVKEFVHGSKTRRWAVAWSWQDRRPALDVARGTAAVGKQYLPFPSLATLNSSAFSHSNDAGKALNELMSSMSGSDFRWKYNPARCVGIGAATKNVWSRSARRKKDRQMDIDDESEDAQNPVLMFKASISQPKQSEGGQTELTVVWLFGKDSVLFESLCGMLKRELSKSHNE